MTRAEYDGDNPLRLADEIDAALAKYGLGSDRRMCKSRPARLTEWPHQKKLRNTLSN
jgi:hypothetical protein